MQRGDTGKGHEPLTPRCSGDLVQVGSQSLVPVSQRFPESPPLHRCLFRAVDTRAEPISFPIDAQHSYSATHTFLSSWLLATIPP